MHSWAKEYNKKRWDKSYMEPEFREGDQVLVSSLNFNNIKAPKRIRDSFLGPFTIIELIGKNAVEVKLPEEFSRKHPVFPVSLFKLYFQTEEDKFPSRKKNPTPPNMMEVEDSSGPVKQIIKARKIKLNGKNAVEVKLTKEFSRKHPVFPVSLVKPYFQTEEDKFPSRKKNTTPPGIVEVEDSPGPVKKIIKARKIRLNGKDQRQYLVIFKNQTADKDKWLAEDAIPDGNFHLRRFRASRRTEQSHQ
ncbi:hypothetical protein O181_039073 [Austropuccinia psidii MF-1]|uniref:Tf2-1-like SH3-like domain-containing protein n=1 Tax=Austropuccinia psidii MF-1 TaxID=1389203 RepID=A0A9Q3HBL8_9BASI|nr:hypothetical protein [Austropuccinia psidii MF-1]